MRILAIDDEKDTRRLLRDILGSAGHQVIAAADAVQGLFYAEIGRFDLILLDLMMPVMDGRQLARVLARHWNTFDTPIIVLSCLKDEAARREVRNLGCVSFLEKPFSPAELLTTVAACARKYPQVSPAAARILPPAV